MSFRLERSGMEKSPLLKALKFGDPSNLNVPRRSKFGSNLGYFARDDKNEK